MIHKGRRALARMFIELALAFDTSTYPPGKPTGETDANRTLVAVAVMLGHADSKAMTSSELASYLKMPRTSVLRRLNSLMKRGLVTRIHDRYYISPKRAKQVPYLDVFDQILANGFAALGPLLSKLDR